MFSATGAIKKIMILKYFDFNKICFHDSTVGLFRNFEYFLTLQRIQNFS